MMLRMRWLALGVLFLLMGSNSARSEVKARKDSMDRDYYLYVPERIDKNKTYWLVVGVHGYGGNGAGAGGIADWVKHGDCIVVGPSFPNEGYQLLREESGEQLEKLCAELQKDYKLQPRMFLFGFSGGAQFAHRFMMKYPDLVAGCAAHSAGSWATGGAWGEADEKAAEIPLVMSCGENDTEKMHPQAPFSRLEWARQFEKVLTEKKFMFSVGYWPGTGHQYSKGAQAMTEQCYQMATQTLPGYEKMLVGIKVAIAQDKLGIAIGQVNKSKQTATKNALPMLVQAVGRHNASLEKLMGEIDDKGVEKVEATVASAQTPADKAKALRQLQIELRGAPKSTAAVVEAIKKVGK